MSLCVLFLVCIEIILQSLLYFTVGVLLTSIHVKIIRMLRVQRIHHLGDNIDLVAACPAFNGGFQYVTKILQSPLREPRQMGAQRDI